MKKLNKKKGFTIVELVIVIAVVGVLTAVLVPTFVNLANQARKAENQTFVKNLNTQMAIREATEGKNKTMYEAMMEAEDIGFNVEKLTPYDGNDIVWDSVANRFAIVGSDYATKKTVVYADGEIKATSIHQLWKIYDSLGAVPEADKQTYSVYAKEGWDLTGLDSKVFTVGFDAGKNKTIGHETKYARQATASSLRESISGKAPRMLEENGQEVTIRTTGGTLTVNAPAVTIKHFGDADNVNIVSVASASYNENGKVALIRVASGRIELGAEADVAGLHINGKVESIAADGTITYSTTKFDNDITLAIGDKKVSLTRDSVGDANIGGDSKLLVCKVETANKSEYIWLDGDGTIENSNVYVSSNANGSDAVAVNTKNASDAAKAIANGAINTGTEQKPIYTPVDTGIAIDTSDDQEVWAAFDSQAKLEYLINQTSFTNLKQAANIENMTNIVIPEGRTIDIDMNGHSVTTTLESEGVYYYAFSNKGSFTLNDSVGGSVINARGIQNLGGEMVLNAGKLIQLGQTGNGIFNGTDKTTFPDYYVRKADFDLTTEEGQQLYEQFKHYDGVVVEDVQDTENADYVYYGSFGNGIGAYIKSTKPTRFGNITVNYFEVEANHCAFNNDTGCNAIINDIKLNSTCSSTDGIHKNNFVYCLKSTGNITINGGIVNGVHGAIGISNGNAIINNVTASTKVGDSGSHYAIYVAGENGTTTATINGGTFTGGRLCAAYIGNSNKNGDGGIGASASVTINGGTFTGYGSNPAFKVSKYNDNFGVGYAFISGGTFNSEPSSQYIVSGHTVYNNEDGTWTVK